MPTNCSSSIGLQILIVITGRYICTCNSDQHCSHIIITMHRHYHYHNIINAIWFVQVPLLSLLFLLLAVMNSATLFNVMYKRPKGKKVEKYKSL